MSLSPSTVTLSAFASTHIWDYRVCVQPTRRASSHFAKRSPTKKLLLFNSLFSWMLLWNQTSVNVFFGCAPGFRHHDVIVWNCRNSRLVMSWRSITTISRWVPVVAGSRVTWNSIFYISEFSFRVFLLATIFNLYQNANLAGFGMFVRDLSNHYYGYTFFLTLWSRRG